MGKGLAPAVWEESASLENSSVRVRVCLCVRGCIRTYDCEPNSQVNALCQPSAAIYCTDWLCQAAAGIARREASPSSISPQLVRET